mgnify:CR=1 FL=1
MKSMKNHNDNIFDPSEGRAFVEGIRSGAIKKGLGIGDKVADQHLIYKPEQLVFINGHDNVGKTDWILWYFVVLSTKYNLKWDIFSAENSIGSLKIKILQFMTGINIFKIPEAMLYRKLDEMTEYFNFIRNDKLFDAKQILEISAGTKSNGLLIDPYNSLKGMGLGNNKHEEDYEICALMRIFCKQTHKSLYVNTHLVTEAARKKYPKDHEYEGHLMPPEKADTEGGQKFANRADDFISIHRMTQHKERFNITEVHVRKVKETLTGGSVTTRENPLLFTLNEYCKFTIGGVDVLAKNETQQVLTTLNNKKNEGFETESVQADADPFPF